jgi:multidrug efflux system membrane fusion protein
LSTKNLVAILIGIAMAVWLLSGTLSSADKPGTQAQTEESEALYLVRAQRSQAAEKVTALEVSGQTEANRTVTVRAEVAGKVAKVAAEQGSFVAAGDLLCQIAEDNRGSELAEAKAAFKSAKLEHQGLLDLKSRGLQSEINVARAEATLATAEARVKRAELALTNTEIRAPFAGVVEEQPVEQGDYLNVGQACVTIMEVDPIVVRGRVAERSINQVNAGEMIDIALITGEQLQGKVTFIARSPDATTRTYEIEATVADPGPGIRAGMSARMTIPLRSQLAHLISPAALVLNDAGDMGVRIVDDENRVAFKPVHILSESPEGIWVDGLPNSVNLITVGQEDVFSGQIVEVDFSPIGASTQAVSQNRTAGVGANPGR